MDHQKRQRRLRGSMAGTDEPQERRTNLVERLAVLEVGIQNVLTMLESSTRDIRDSTHTIQRLVNDISLHGERLSGLRGDVDSLSKGLNTKATREQLIALDRRVTQNEELLRSGVTVLHTINWAIRIFGAGAVGTFGYWVSTGQLPGG